MPTTTINLTGQAAASVNDTNVTLTLGGTPATALLKGVSFTMGWTGTLADARIASAATWNAKQNALGFTPEDVANKDTDGTLAANSDTKYASQKATKTYADTKVAKASVPCELIVACSDLTTALTTGTTKAYFRAPYAFTLTAVRASLGTAQASGSIFTVDINESGTSVLSTKLTIDNTEKTSTTAATPPVISDSAIADDSELTIDIDQVGDGTAKGLIVTLIGTHAV